MKVPFCTDPVPVVSSISKGMTVLLNIFPGRSLSTSVGASFFITLNIKFSTLLWRHIILPWFRATGQKLIIWARVPCGQEHRGQVARTFLPHLFRLEEGARDYVASLIKKAIMFLGIPLINDCQVTDCSSFTKSLFNSLWIVSLWTF